MASLVIAVERPSPSTRANALSSKFADADRLFVPIGHADLVRKLTDISGVPPRLSSLGAVGGDWVRTYRLEALPHAYEWPGLGKFPGRSKENTTQAWHRACATYLDALHADPSYQQAAKEYFGRQHHEPQPLLDWWVYRSIVVRVESTEYASEEERVLLVRQYILRRERSTERMRREVETLERLATSADRTREPIPETVRLFVWRRDEGQCVRCGSRERLEFDHIIPIVAGGGNTERNIQLLCEACNRSKSSSI
jgi:5-methylcytosine-specific restriction endonuclease McrA